MLFKKRKNWKEKGQRRGKNVHRKCTKFLKLYYQQQSQKDKQSETIFTFVHFRFLFRFCASISQDNGNFTKIGLPVWLRWTHFWNFFFSLFLLSVLCFSYILCQNRVVCDNFDQENGSVCCRSIDFKCIRRIFFSSLLNAWSKWIY